MGQLSTKLTVPLNCRGIHIVWADVGDSKDVIFEPLILQVLETEDEIPIKRYFNDLFQPFCYFHISLPHLTHYLRYRL